MAKKQNAMMGMAKDSMMLGTFSMAGLGAMGAVKGMAPAEAGPAFNAASAGIGLANVGQTANIGMGLSKMLSGGEYSKKKKK